MTDNRKNAYRYLLYYAMLDIRPLAWFGTWRLLNLFRIRGFLRMVRRRGQLADRMHNLALFSALDFGGFDEDWFWRDMPFAEESPPMYRDVFERRLLELEQRGE